jgi:putative heme iron utilization protein
MFGLPLFGLSNVSGNPAKQGIYSLGGYDRNYPKILNLEWLISTGRYAGVDIGAMEMAGTTLLVAWKCSDTITMTIANPGVVTWTAHGQTNGAPIMFTTTGALPTGVSASTYYYIRVINANTFHLYDTYAHAIDTGSTTGRVVTSGTQSGVHTCANYGIDALDTTAKVTSAYFATRALSLERDVGKVVSGYVGYRSLPNDSTIKVYYKTNYATDWVEATTVIDTDRKIVTVKEAFPEATVLEIKVESNAATGANVNNAPEIEVAEFNFEE